MPNLFHENEYIFNVLFEAVSESVIVVDQNQIIVANNSAAEEIFGYSKGELQNKHLNILIPKNTMPVMVDILILFIKKSSKRQMGDNRELFGAT